MLRTRLLFEKTGRAQYISHLDLLRTFQRVFLRAGIRLRHTEGFNPHPYLSFALPLPVGSESLCELLDFDLAEDIDLGALPARLNAKMPEGIRAVKAYRPETKFADLAYIRVEGAFFYDAGVPGGTVDKLAALFREKTLVISKKSKKGFVDFDIAPCVQSILFTPEGFDRLAVRAVITAQNPALNPENLVAAVRTHLPSCTPDFASFKRLEVLRRDNNVFR
ncbi:radical SAM-linked protein [Sporobacter termitidis DSM 10068]|uniref:Radical SAM-linked protein n=1 Tax=Sporobacter termitidis DSM 10068 TaxID=1123282 RepID=A0A1M5TP63_9FIRM|nr:TIGR03936 family radical SAM-associated protein [Sporobacter termitidis]SHH52542.1 radical SAM-linked protein [Sporobacter termitidis DSM 10068]